MPEIILKNKKAHICYKCHHKIKIGEGYKVWYYSDKDMYKHLYDCKK